MINIFSFQKYSPHKLIIMELNEDKLHELLGKMVTEMGAAANGALIIM